MVGVYAAGDVSTLNEGWVEEQHPTVVLLSGSIVWFSAELSRGVGQQRSRLLLIVPDAIVQVVRKVLLQEDAIDIEEVDGVAYLTHLIIMYHTHMRMLGGCPDVVGVVVDAVDFQVYFHRYKDNKVQCFLQ